MKNGPLNNSSGVAIVMVMAAVTIITLLLGSFTYFTSINKIRIYSNQDKRQARLTAEAGLNMAMAQLEIFKEAFNLYQKNKSVQSMIPFNLLESALTQPFAYPIPVNEDSMNLIQKTALEDFEKTTKLKGQLLMTISPITGFINPNSLMIIREDNSQNGNASFNDQDKSDKQLHELMREELTRILDLEIRTKIENDDIFAEKFSNIDPEKLTSELQYFVSNPALFDSVDKGEFEILYENYRPKFAPMISKEEMYLLAGWPEEIVDLIIDRISPHNVTLIPLNKISKPHLRVLFPQLAEEQINDFFVQRDGDPKEELPPTPIKNLDDFKRVIKMVSSISESEINKRLDELKKLGLELSVASKVFKIEITGTFGLVSQTINAIVDLPVLPTSLEKKENSQPKDPELANEADPPPLPEESQPSNQNKKEEKPTELMSPRIVEIFYR
tara:strand:- start:8323 stop:9651 length:1329 start_codon:yes stop_codon:yes gene_type:complete